MSYIVLQGTSKLFHKEIRREKNEMEGKTYKGKKDLENIPVICKVLFGILSDEHRFSNYETIGKYLQSTIIYFKII